MSLVQKLWICGIIFLALNNLVSQEMETNDKHYISKNTQVQMLIAKTFLEDKFETAEGFYDPRLGVVLYLVQKKNIDCLDPSQRIPECLREKILKMSFLLNVRKILSKTQRVFLQIEYFTGSRLEIWKRELLDKLETSDYSEKTEFGYLELINGKHTDLGEYPRWNLIQKILQITQKKFYSLGLESVNGMFVPAVGFIFIIKTESIPVKKLAKLNRKLLKELRALDLSILYVIEFFYGGKKGELSNFMFVKNGKNDYLKYWYELE